MISKKIIASIVSLSLMISSIIVVSASYQENQMENFEIIESNEFNVSLIEEINFDVSKFSSKELLFEIEKQKDIQEQAHLLAENARNLGWPEDCSAIVNAGNEWANAFSIISYYEKEYSERMKKEQAYFWNVKKSQYPEATEIWLFLKSLNYNDYVCAGILGNIMTEVGGQTLNIKPFSQNNGYYGICQWNKHYKEVWGSSLKRQCVFLKDTIKQEFDTFGFIYQKNFNYKEFLLLNNFEETAIAFAKCYERCDSSSYGIRQKNAKIAYNYFVS